MLLLGLMSLHLDSVPISHKSALPLMTLAQLAAMPQSATRCPLWSLSNSKMANLEEMFCHLIQWGFVVILCF